MMSRRAALRLLGLGAVVGIATACSTTPSQAPAAAPPTNAPAQAAQPTAAGAAPAAKAPTPTPVVEAKTSGAVSGGEVVKITAWTIGPDAPSFFRRDNLIAAADTVNQELQKEGSNQRVQVEATFESGGQWADYKQKFVLASEAKQGPDIILSGHEDLSPWAAAGHVIELDSMVKKYDARFTDLIPTLWDAVKLTGKTYAIPQDTEARPV
ncbi:MAG TPA: extracellular solute-binding protein, partial [Chloroflexota bacterium]|nr:extracellular solute-binding protein [Chloroflexota bacterium]